MEYAFALVAALLVGSVYFHVRESAAWREERSELLDRVMARSYNEFAYTATTTTPAEPVSDDTWHEQNAARHPDLYPDGPGAE